MRTLAPAPPYGELCTTEVDLFVGRNYLVSLHTEPVPSLSEARLRWERALPSLANRIGLLALSDELGLARAPLFHPGLNVSLGQFDARRTAIHHTADGGPMAFAKSGDTEEMAECVMGHD